MAQRREGLGNVSLVVSAGTPSAVPRLARLLAGLLLLALVTQAAMAALLDSVTADEFVSLPVGLYTLQTGDFRSVSMNPPFVRSFSALPLLFGGPQAPQMPPMDEAHDWATGYAFMNQQARGYHDLFVPARCMAILAAAVLGMVVMAWATAMYGALAGVIALFFYALCPAILAYGHLVTLDIFGALGWTGASYLTWRLLERPNVSRAVLLGLGLGLAPVLKLSGIVVPILSGFLVFVGAARATAMGYRMRLLRLFFLAALVALGALNGLYRFDGFGAAFREIPFESAKMKAIAAATPGLRLPLPVPFLGSLDTLFVGDQPAEPTYFLAGEWSMNGWWYYHLVAFALKTPIPLLLGGGLALLAWAFRRGRATRDDCVFVPILFVFVSNSALNPLNIGVRHALPALPFLAIGASAWLAAWIEPALLGARRTRDVAGALLGAALLTWFLWASLSVSPRYLEYFNEIAGGPRGGHRWLIDSNLDWGQDLIRVRRYMTEHHLDSVHLAYFGRVDPRVYGISYSSIVESESHGTAIVSASFLMGRPYWLWRAPGELVWSPHGAFTWLQKHPPVARVGSMFVFDLP